MVTPPAEPLAYIGIPLRASGRVMGVLAIVKGVDQPALTVEELSLLTSVADQLGAVVESARLRERFPDLPIAVVTHGREQFGLLANEADGPLADIHGSAQKLRAEEIDLHVCGVHAGWDGYTPEDFPAYVDVSASGPAQIRDYRNIGFVLIELERADP